ncbi:MAG: AAA family ATPase [bacterium]
MKLVIIFGPPASGKLTVGKLLSKKTGFPLLHNHLTNNLLVNFFPYESKQFSGLNKRFRHEILKSMLQAKQTGLIMTFVWAFNQNSDKQFISKIIITTRQFSSRPYLVELTCLKSTLLQRVNNSSRNKMKKVLSKKFLSDYLKQHQMNSPSGYMFPAPHLAINTDTTKPKQSVVKIRRFIGS